MIVRRIILHRLYIDTVYHNNKVTRHGFYKTTKKRKHVESSFTYNECGGGKYTEYINVDTMG
jgi:hypothetical protein